MRIPIIGGAYKGRASTASVEDAVNLYPEMGQTNPPIGSMVNVWGGILFSQLPSGEVRGMREFGGDLYVVCGPSLYRVDETGAYFRVGGIGSSTGPVCMTDNGPRNGKQLVMADGGPLKVYDLDSGVITTTSSPRTERCVFLDGYIIFVEKDTGQFWWTAIYDATTLDALDFATAEGAPDDLVTIITYNRNIILPGDDSTETWYNAGTEQTFQRFQGGFMEMGCAAPHSIQIVGNSVCWLGKSRRGKVVPVTMADYQVIPMTMDHPQIEQQIAQYSVVSDAISYAYSHEGHHFYVLTFPTENVTWVYDLAGKEWHRRAHIVDGAYPNRERFNCHAVCFGKHLTGDFKNGKIYEMDSRYVTLDGDIIPNTRETRLISTEEEDRIRIVSIQLVGEEGVGGDVTLQYSKDGGRTWSAERTVSFGEIGQYRHRAIWRQLGMAREWVFRFTRWADAKTIYTGLIGKGYGEH